MMSKMINRCRLFLQIISVYDLLIYKTNRLHPAYIKGEIPISQNSTIAWPAYTRPPKNYWKIWHSFIHFHIEPYVRKLPLQWNSHTSLRFSSSYYKHRYSHHLYKLVNDQLVTFKLGSRSTTRSQTTYINVPYLSDVIFHSEDFFCVDVHSHKKGLTLTVLGPFPPPFTSRTTTPPNSLHEYFEHSLHSSLQDICGRAFSPLPQRVQINTIYQRVDSEENICIERCFPKKW